MLSLPLSTFLPLGSRARTSITVSFSTPIIHAFSTHLLYSGCTAALEVGRSGGHAERISYALPDSLDANDGPANNRAVFKGFSFFAFRTSGRWEEEESPDRGPTDRRDGRST